MPAYNNVKIAQGLSTSSATAGRISIYENLAVCGVCSNRCNVMPGAIIYHYIAAKIKAVTAIINLEIHISSTIYIEPVRAMLIIYVSLIYN